MEELKCGDYDKCIDAFYKCGNCSKCLVPPYVCDHEWSLLSNSNDYTVFCKYCLEVTKITKK